MIKISKNTKSQEWQYSDVRDTSYDVSPKVAIAKAIETGLITDNAPIPIIGQGKEAIVFYGLNEHDQWAVVKMYKLYNSAHRQILLHTPFTHPYDVLKRFPDKEFTALTALHKNSIPCPVPFTLNEFGYSMSLIGDDLCPAPLLAHVNKRLIEEPSDVLEECIEILRDMYSKAHYVHGDFSEHNLLYHNEKIYVIDFLQSEHFLLNDNVTYGSGSIKLSESLPIIKRDLHNIIKFFEKSFRIYVDYDEVLEYCIRDYKKQIDNVNELRLETELSDV